MTKFKPGDRVLIIATVIGPSAQPGKLSLKLDDFHRWDLPEGLFIADDREHKQEVVDGMARAITVLHEALKEKK